MNPLMAVSNKNIQKKRIKTTNSASKNVNSILALYCHAVPIILGWNHSTLVLGCMKKEVAKALTTKMNLLSFEREKKRYYKNV